MMVCTTRDQRIKHMIYYAGRGCTCSAKHEYECSCQGVDWTPAEIYKYMGKIRSLESQVISLTSALITAKDTLEDVISEIENNL